MGHNRSVNSTARANVPNEVLGAALFAASPTVMCPMNICMLGEPDICHCTRSVRERKDYSADMGEPAQTFSPAFC